jgi:hypothetical protein
MASASRRNFQIVSCAMFLGGEATGSEDALAPARADELRLRRCCTPVASSTQVTKGWRWRPGWGNMWDRIRLRERGGGREREWRALGWGEGGRSRLRERGEIVRGSDSRPREQEKSRER